MRRFWVGLMIFFAVLLMVLATLAGWIRATVIDTDGFISLTSEILEAPEVQSAIADEIATVVFEQPEVEEAVVEVIPEPLRPFQGPIISGAQEGLKQAVLFVMGNKLLGDILETQLVKVHDDLIDGKDITFGLSDVADALGLSDQDGVIGQATDLIPEDFGTITVLKRDDAPWLYQLIDILKNLWLWLFLASLALFAGAIAASQRRRKTIYTAALSLGITSIVVILIIQIGRSVVLGSLPSDVSQSAAETIVGIVLRGVRSRFIWLAVFSFIAFGIAIAWGKLGITTAVRDFSTKTWKNVRTKRAEIAVATAGEAGTESVETVEASRWQRIRRDLGDFAGELEIGERTQQASNYVQGRIRMLRGIGIIVGAVILLLWPGPTTAVVIWIGALVILYLGTLEILAGHAEEEIAVAADATTRTEQASGVEPAPATTEPEPAPEAEITEKAEPEAAAQASAASEAEPTLMTEPAEKAEPVEPAPKDYEQRLRLLRELGELKELGILNEREIREEKKKILGT